MSSKKSSELSRDDLIKLIEERAEDVCGGKMLEVEVRIDELEEELETSKEIINNLKQSLVQAQSDLQTLNVENKQLKTLVTTLQENKDLRNNKDVMQLKKEVDVLKKEKSSKSHATDIKKLQQDFEGLTKIREELDGIKNQGDLSAFQQEIQHLKQSRDGINKHLLKKEKQIKMLKIGVDRMDQKQRKN